jgi:hypothetical protein
MEPKQCAYFIVARDIIFQYPRFANELFDGKVGFRGSRHAMQVTLVVGEHRTRVKSEEGL